MRFRNDSQVFVVVRSSTGTSGTRTVSAVLARHHRSRAHVTGDRNTKIWCATFETDARTSPKTDHPLLEWSQKKRDLVCESGICNRDCAMHFIFGFFLVSGSTFNGTFECHWCKQPIKTSVFAVHVLSCPKKKTRDASDAHEKARRAKEVSVCILFW